MCFQRQLRALLLFDCLAPSEHTQKIEERERLGHAKYQRKNDARSAYRIEICGRLHSEAFLGLMQVVKGTSHGQTHEQNHVYDLTEAVKVEKLFLADALDILRHRYQDKAILNRHATKVDLQDGAHEEDWFFLDLL